MRGDTGPATGDTTRAAVLALLSRHGPASRAEVAQRLSLSPATITQVTRRLLAEGLVAELGQRQSQGGRPAIPISIVPTAAHALGVHVAARHLSGVLVQADAQIVDRFQRPFDPTKPNAIDELITAIKRQIDRISRHEQPLLGVGVTVPGVVDPTTGTIRQSIRLGWPAALLADMLRAALNVPVLVDNDINSLTATEHWYGPGADWSDFLVLDVGEGIGLGMVLDGTPYRGATGGAGEFGHFPLVPNGLTCSCGNRGCLETVLTVDALIAQARQLGALGSAASPDDLRAVADNGHAGVIELLAAAGTILGRALAGVVNLLAPEAVVVIGEITVVWPHVAEHFLGALRANTLASLREVPIEVREWDDDRQAFGAAGIVLAAPLAVPRQRTPTHR